MAVEKMKMMNMVAPIRDMHDVLQEIVLLERIHIKNAVREIRDSNFTLSVLEEHLDSIADMGHIVSYRGGKENFQKTKDRIRRLEESLGAEVRVIERPAMHKPMDEYERELDLIEQDVSPVHKALEDTLQRIAQHKDFLKSIKHLQGMAIDVSELSNMEFFNYHIGTLSKEKRLKLRNNYENISAVVLHIGSSIDGEVYLVFSPVSLEPEAERILKSLNFKEIDLPKEFSGTPNEVYQKLLERIEADERQAEVYKESLAGLLAKHEENLDAIYSRLLLEEKIELLKQNAAVSENFFYFCGWIPAREAELVKQKVTEVSERVIIVFSEDSDVPAQIVPPTKLKNSWLFRPFEMLVNIYGVPNYKETDPTVFLAITYLVLFGAMFGDVGQGGVLLLAGLFFRTRKPTKGYGEILVRLGVSSVIFGFLYGSLFGSEEILPALLVRPMEDIDLVLYSSVAFGVVLLLISYVISLKNLWRRKDLEQGLFGRNGLTGLCFYITLLSILVQTVSGTAIVPSGILIGAAVLEMALMLLRKPIYAKLFKQELHYEDGKKEYYIESGFDSVETLISLLSNTVSFIRVGAFALNHVGLFLAFSTMAHLVQNKAIGLLILVIGNIIIIGLEGLIVFIQGLRLEYYELFSKYYSGDGMTYSPLQFQESNR